ncbi:helicase associated domain-containing protein [Sinomonas susongensis]|uniref:helicase associated domain-containing protein n=1 Tax=Sinomonas susongensis TaxID=1324851 RepID=UPI00110930BE|nr:helicase associated domain-containing protein [Sinomonas susongensis]
MTLEPHVLRELALQLRELAGVPELGSVALPEPPPGKTWAPPESSPAVELRPEFRRRLSAVADFKAANGRLPQTGGIITPAERSLGVWLLRQRRRDQAGRLPEPEQDALAGALGPAWMLPPGAAWWAENSGAEADESRPRRRNRATADDERHRAPWSPEEEALVLNEDLSLAEIAAKIGRTHAAVRNRRQILRSASRRTW